MKSKVHQSKLGPIVFIDKGMMGYDFCSINESVNGGVRSGFMGEFSYFLRINGKLVTKHTIVKSYEEGVKAVLRDIKAWEA